MTPTSLAFQVRGLTLSSWISLLFLFLLVSACRREESPPAGMAGRVFSHPNGLSVSLQPGYDAAQTSAGFVVAKSESEKQRIPLRATVAIASEPPAARGSVPQSITRADRVFEYDVQHLPGGSGGDEYSIRIWMRAMCPNRTPCYVVVEEQTQSELGEPSFSLAWSLATRAAVALSGS